MFDILSNLFSPYKQLNQFHSDMKKGMLFSRRYELPAADSVVPVLKYRMLREKIRRDSQLAQFPIFEIKEGPGADELELVHTRDYIQDFMEFIPSNEIISAEVPLTFEVQEFFLHATAASREGLRMARESGGTYINLGGGFHHAFAHRAEGFCFLNDINFAVESEIRRKPGRGLILDLDVHQGNGIVNFFKDRDDVTVANLHQSDNYPIKEEGGINIGLPGGTSGEEYLTALSRLLSDLRVDAGGSFDFAVYLGGADPYENDRLGGLHLTKDELLIREQTVRQFFDELKIPVLAVLAGGYAPNIEDVVDIHYNMVKTMLGSS